MTTPKPEGKSHPGLLLEGWLYSLQSPVNRRIVYTQYCRLFIYLIKISVHICVSWFDLEKCVFNKRSLLHFYTRPENSTKLTSDHIFNFSPLRPENGV